MKLIGAIIIIIAATLVGFEFARRLRERPRQLRQLKVALQSLEAEIMYGLTPLAEASEYVAKQQPKPLAILFSNFVTELKYGEEGVAKAWEQSLRKMWHLTALRNGELEIMKQFGATLGQHDKEQQQKHFRLTLTHLEREEMEAIEAQKRYEKMFRSLGFLTGLLIVLLMM